MGEAEIIPEWYREYSLGGIRGRLKKLEAEYEKFFSFLRIAEGKNVKSARAISADDVRDVHIGRLLEVAPARDTSERATYLCPLHSEKTPSFVWFKEDNHYHCYGCQAHGDVISLAMAIHSFGFREALEYLSKI